MCVDQSEGRACGKKLSSCLRVLCSEAPTRGLATSSHSENKGSDPPVLCS